MKRTRSTEEPDVDEDLLNEEKNDTIEPPLWRKRENLILPVSGLRERTNG